MMVALGGGPWDALFGGENIPASVLASVSAFTAGVSANRELLDLSNNVAS